MHLRSKYHLTHLVYFGQRGTHLQHIRREICLEQSEVIKGYISLTEEKWFSAKEVIDDKFSPDMKETSKFDLLCDIIMVSLLR